MGNCRTENSDSQTRPITLTPERFTGAQTAELRSLLLAEFELSEENRKKSDKSHESIH